MLFAFLACIVAPFVEELSFRGFAFNALLRPVRERRAQLDPAAVPAIVQAGSEKARAVAAPTIAAVKSAMKL